jgi:hypothetical protein
MVQKKQIVQFVVQNRTDCGFNVPIFEFNVFSVNATTKYTWDVTTADYSCLQALITINGVTYTIDFDGTLNGLLVGLNALNYGFFCSETIGGSTYIYTYDDTNIYADLQTCLIGTTTTTTSTTIAPTTTTTTTTSSTTTTTTASLQYLTDQYVCGTCTLLANNVVVGSNFSLDIGDYFIGDDGRVYQVLGTTTGVPITNISNNTAYADCPSVPCATTTTTTTSTTTLAPTTTSTTTTTTTLAPTTTTSTTTTTTTGVPTTTTTTSTTSTTTTLITCNNYNIEGAPSIDVEWIECDGTTNSATVTTAIVVCAQTGSVTQTGGAGNITQLGVCITPTTTTTTSTTTTTTTLQIVCELWEITNSNNTTTVQYYDCDNILQTIILEPEEIVGCFSVNRNGMGQDQPFNSNFPIIQGQCITTTTTTTTTTETAP